MSSPKDTYVKNPKQRPSDLRSLSAMMQASWRTGQAAAAGEATEVEVARSPSDSSQVLTEGFLARSGRTRPYIATSTPTHGKDKKQISGNKSSPSSADNSDGGAFLNAGFQAPGLVANEKHFSDRTDDDQPPGGQSNNGLSSADGQLDPAPAGALDVNSTIPEGIEQTHQGPMLIIPENMSSAQTTGRLTYSILPPPTSPYQTAQYRAILIDFEETLNRIPTLSKGAFNTINQKFDKVLHDFSRIHNRLNKEVERVTGDHEKLRGRLNALLRQLDAVMQDRKRIASERDSYQIQVNEFALRSGDDSSIFRDLENKLRKEIADLHEQISIQDEQLKGRRALWMDLNSNSASRRRAMSALQDPFDSPSRPQSSGAGGHLTPGSKSNSVSTSFSGAPQYASQEGAGHQSRGIAPHSTTPYAPPGLTRVSTAPTGQSPSSSIRTQRDSFLSPAAQRGYRGDTLNSPHMQRGKGSRRRRNNQGHNPKMSSDPSNPSHTPASLRRYNTEPTSSTDIVPFIPEDERYAEYKDGLNMIYELARNWARSYAFHPDPAKEEEITMNDHALWDFMMNCTYPGHRQDSHIHVKALLRDYDTRFWFVTRMIITYCIQDIMIVDAFKIFSPQVSEAIENAKVSNQERGLANDARQVLVEYQVAAFESMLASSDYEIFRHAQLTDHTMRLREILRPMINLDSSLMQATEEVEAIVVTAWDLAIKMHTSHVTFQIYFPETNAKFNAATMSAINCPEVHIGAKSSQLRLKLVATPVITVRDDRGTTIITKNLHKSSVMIAD